MAELDDIFSPPTGSENHRLKRKKSKLLRRDSLASFKNLLTRKDSTASMKSTLSRKDSISSIDSIQSTLSRKDSNSSIVSFNSLKSPKLKRKGSNASEISFKSPFNLVRKRKRKGGEVEEDNISVKSLDMGTSKKRITWRDSKRRRSLVHMSSILSPVNQAVNKVFSKSLSFKNLKSPKPSKPNKCSTTPYREPRPTPTKRRETISWSESVGSGVKKLFSNLQIKRQEGIFELFQGEKDLIEDLNMVKDTYQKSIMKLGLMTEAEQNKIFGIIGILVPLHENLVKIIEGAKKEDETIEGIGKILVEWVPNLYCYIPYCSNQVYAKDLLEQKKSDKKLQDFLERCQLSSFSRKLDLWSFLDLPRSRLVKYPLLLKNIQKLTPDEHEDCALLEEAIQSIEKIIETVDQKAGEAKCKFTIERLEFLDERGKDIIARQKHLLCEGVLRNNRGTKLHVFLFEEICVLARPATRNDRLCYQVYRQPIPVSEMIFEDLADGEKNSGSFRNAFTPGQSSKFMFKLSFEDKTRGQSHTLIANDEHDKLQWTSCLKKVVPERKPSTTQSDESDC